jgi:hypothetical protein
MITITQWNISLVFFCFFLCYPFAIFYLPLWWNASVVGSSNHKRTTEGQRVYIVDVVVYATCNWIGVKVGGGGPHDERLQDGAGLAPGRRHKPSPPHSMIIQTHKKTSSNIKKKNALKKNAVWLWVSFIISPKEEGEWRRRNTFKHPNFFFFFFYKKGTSSS